MDPKRLFHNLTAWFSNSVTTKHKTLWVKHGGKMDDAKNAQFIFSEDVNCYDTMSLFDSEDFLIGCLTVFHAGFIDACMRQQSAHKVPVSKYVMMPPGLPSELSYITKEVEDRNADAEVVRKVAKRSEKHVTASSNMDRSKGNKSSEEHNALPHVTDIPSVTGPLCDFEPGKNGFTVQRNF